MINIPSYSTEPFYIFDTMWEVNNTLIYCALDPEDMVLFNYNWVVFSSIYFKKIIIVNSLFIYGTVIELHLSIITKINGNCENYSSVSYEIFSHTQPKYML